MPNYTQLCRTANGGNPVYRNHYSCPLCHITWCEDATGECIDTCPVCRCEDVAPDVCVDVTDMYRDPISALAA